MSDRTYARFYFRDFISDYPHIYEDDAALSAWVRLLVLAESMWPAAPELPRSVKTRTLAKLTSCGLVITDGRTFAIKGMDAERTARSNAARIAARSRWGNASAMPKREEEEEETKAIRDGTGTVRARLGLVEPVKA